MTILRGLRRRSARTKATTPAKKTTGSIQPYVMRKGWISEVRLRTASCRSGGNAMKYHTEPPSSKKKGRMIHRPLTRTAICRASAEAMRGAVNKANIPARIRQIPRRTTTLGQ